MTPLTHFEYTLGVQTHENDDTYTLLAADIRANLPRTFSSRLPTGLHPGQAECAESLNELQFCYPEPGLETLTLELLRKKKDV